MPPLELADLRRPLRLLRTRAPWTALLYLALEAVAGALSIGVWLTVLLIPLWLLFWPRVELRLLPLAGRQSPEVPRRRGVLRWQDVVVVLLTAVMAAAVFFAGIFLIVLLGVLFATPFAVLSGREVTAWSADQVLPSVPAAVIAPILGLVVLLLVLWAATALAYGWSGISLALLRDEERRLAAQVDALGDMTVQRDDVVAIERRALERDLHDGAQMHLSAASMRLGLLQLDAELLPAGGRHDQILVGLEAVREQLDLGGRAVREAASGLVAPVLRDSGLQGALQELAHALPLATELECEVPRLAEELEHSVHLIAREGVTNVVRHSGATHVRIACGLTGATAPDPVRESGSTLVLRITDDGHGGADTTGTGLISMQARARRLGGTLQIDSPDGGPTILLLRVPTPPGGDAP